MNRQVKKPRFHRFSCLVIIMTMLLFGVSGVSEAGAGLAKAAVKTGGKEALEAAIKTGSKESIQAASRKLFGESLSSATGKINKDLFESLAKKFGDDVIELGLKSSDEMLEVGLKFSDDALGTAMKMSDSMVSKLDDIGADALQKFDPSDFLKKGDLPSLVKGLDDLGIKNADTIADGMIKSQKALAGDTFLGKFRNLKKSIFETSQDAGEAYLHKSQKYIDNAKTLADPASNAAAKKAATKSNAKLNMSVTRRTIGSAGDLLKSGAKWGAMGMAGAVLFMGPSIFQSMYLAEQMKNAMLETYLPPIKFGNVVLQMPDSVVNMANPVMSQFIYYGIPVDNVGQKPSAESKLAYPGVSGPSENNKLSKQVHNGLAQAVQFDFEDKQKISIARYNLDAQALATLPVFVSYSDMSWTPWASNGIPDATFLQKMVNLNTGYVLFGDGTSQGILPASLLGPKGNVDTVQSYLGYAVGKLGGASFTSEFREFVQGVKSESAGKVTGPITDLFDCGCLANNNGVLSEETIQTCSVGNRTKCLLTKSLNQLSAGLVINSQGQAMTADQDLATEVAQGALGQVISIQGYGKKFDEVLQVFPGAQQDALANSGALTVSIGSDLSSVSDVKIQGADPDNYVAKGMYVYQCKNTPLAKILKSQSGGSAAINNHITDFIVFLDSDLNQVPMMAPVQDLNNYGFITMGLNPAIKYFSTLIGNFDENGNFNFVPQLNIQSPPALVAKGLPTSFPPLYALNAANGSLAVNYNQNLTAVIGGIVQGLMSDPKLGQQFRTMQTAMLDLLGNGPYGQYNLQPVPTDMQPVIGGSRLTLYTGFNGYPVSQDTAYANCSDLLIPLSDQGKTVTLPSNNVSLYYGLVTDLTYTVQADGSIFVDADGFSNSPLLATGMIDESKAAQYHWVDRLTEMGQGNDSQFAMPDPLLDFVVQARAAWINWVQGLSQSGLSVEEFMGIQVSGTQNIFTIASEQALKNGLYVYAYTPSPSTSSPDYFILTNSLAPQASDYSLGKMSAQQATAQTNMLSIVSGLLYDASGNQIKSGSGAAYTVDPKVLLQTLNRLNPQAFSNNFKAKLNISSGKAASAAMEMVYPFQFANLQLGLYQADINSDVYLYFDAAGASASEDFQPEDYFVTVDSYTKPSSIGTKLSPETGFVVSLVSGNVYGPAGMVATISPQSIISSLSKQWRPGVAAEIKNLTAQLAATMKNNEQETAVMNAAPVANSGDITLSKAAVVQIVNNIASQDYLVAPYDQLKKDPMTGVYVLVVPANPEETEFMYGLFNVPNSIVDGQGQSARAGALYDGQGNLLRVFKGIELASMMKQYGVAVDSAGKQSLSVSSSLPILKLDPADIGLKPGKSGKLMLCSNHADFPSSDIKSPISYQNSKFYIYYNMISQSYYAMQVTGSDIRYIDMAGGSVYNLDGSPRIAANPVAVNNNGDMNDLFLPYTTIDGFVTCMMRNVENEGAYSGFWNSEQDFQVAVDPATNSSAGFNLLYSLDDADSIVNVAQMPFSDSLTALPELSMTNQYNVYFDKSGDTQMYTVNPGYAWQQLQMLPIDMKTREILNPLPDYIYSDAGLINSKNGMYAMVFAGKLYSQAQKTDDGSYVMKSGSQSISVSMQKDAKVNTEYVQVIAGGVTYNYQCLFLTLSETEFLDYLGNAWRSQVVADVTGKVLLEKYITVNGSGNLELVPVSMNKVANVPKDSAAKSALASNLGLVLQDVGTGNFVTRIDANIYPYFPQNGYVDLETGVLFDEAGLLVGYTLQYVDYIKLLSDLNVVVIRDGKGNSVLSYRAPIIAPFNEALSSLSTAKSIPKSTELASYNSGGSHAKPVVRVAPVATVSSEIANLEQQNAQLQADIEKRQSRLKKEKIASRKQVLKDAITMNQQQIALNNENLAQLGATSSASSGARVLGRLSSKTKKSSSKTKKKNK